MDSFIVFVTVFLINQDYQESTNQVVFLAQKRTICVWYHGRGQPCIFNYFRLILSIGEISSLISPQSALFWNCRHIKSTAWITCVPKNVVSQVWAIYQSPTLFSLWHFDSPSQFLRQIILFYALVTAALIKSFRIACTKYTFDVARDWCISWWLCKLS